MKKKIPDANAPACPECGNKPINDAYGKPWPARAEVHHCEGGVGFACDMRGEAHHSDRAPVDCWRCHKRAGCKVCLRAPDSRVWRKGILVHQDNLAIIAVCKSCLVWCCVEGLLDHGPISNRPDLRQKRRGRVAPGLEEYPLEWQLAYNRLPSVNDLQGMTLSQMVAQLSQKFEDLE